MSDKKIILIKHILLLDDENLNKLILKDDIKLKNNINTKKNISYTIKKLFYNKDNVNVKIYKVLITNRIYNCFSDNKNNELLSYDLFRKIRHNIINNYNNLIMNIINFLSKLVDVKYITDEYNENYNLIINNAFVDYMLMYSYYKWEDMKLFHGLKNIDVSKINFDNNLTDLEKKIIY